MTSEERNAAFKEATKHEVAFLEGEGQGHKNANGAYCYQSNDGNDLIALDFYLMHYKQWLIENKILREPQ
jgi:hypothetical protein